MKKVNLKEVNSEYSLGFQRWILLSDAKLLYLKMANNLKIMDNEKCKKLLENMSEESFNKFQKIKPPTKAQIKAFYTLNSHLAI